MRPLLSYSAVFLFALIFQNPVTNASLVTETFAGNGTLLFSDTGTSSGNSFTVVQSVSQGCAEISFDVSISTTSGNGTVTIDSATYEGFGDSGGGNASVQQNNSVTETMQFSISNLVVSPSASAPAGTTIQSNNLVIGFTSFDMINNGGNAPALTWADNTGGSGSAQAAAGTSTGDITLVPIAAAGSAGVTTIDITPTDNFMWFNDAQFEYSGDVVVNKPDSIPEPGSFALLLAGLSLVSTRRRRQQ